MIAITAPPSHTMTNTISNRRVLSSAFVAAESTLKKIKLFVFTYEASIRQKKKGPHRSQLRISFLFSAVSATGLIGLITILSFCHILWRSLFWKRFTRVLDLRLFQILAHRVCSFKTDCWELLKLQQSTVAHLTT